MRWGEGNFEGEGRLALVEGRDTVTQPLLGSEGGGTTWVLGCCLGKLRSMAPWQAETTVPLLRG